MGVSDIFYFFLFRGRGKEGGVLGDKGGWEFLLGNREGVEGSEEGRRGGAHRGWKGIAGRGGGSGG